MEKTRNIHVFIQQLSTILEDLRIVLADEILAVLLVLTMRVVLGIRVEQGRTLN